ncbi:tyrosine-type recombinase/integrase [Paenibacillus dendritiformis]|uniref:tyrosine-type recombinase/integrase n=1 Tax=Paenibacillus dendritiformis TaxID=130049 RepID=UPI001F548ACC|nr:tyrosine-type recombinase/integrase [Paenibacillus dendritiformis]
MTAHVYRHTWARNMIFNGCDPFTLQKMGGWKDIRTMRRYIQMDTSDMRKSHDSYSPVNTLIRNDHDAKSPAVAGGAVSLLRSFFRYVPIIFSVTKLLFTRVIIRIILDI